MADILGNLIGFPALIGLQRDYNWFLMLPDLYGIVVSGAIIAKWCQTVSFRQYDVSEIIKLKKGLDTLHFPDKWDIDRITATFVSPVPDLVSLYFSKWRKLMRDEWGRIGPSDTYKRDMYVILQDRTGIPSNIIKMEGVFPTKQPAYNLSYPGEKVLEYQIDFSVDKIVVGVKALGDLASTVVPVATGALASISNVLR